LLPGSDHAVVDDAKVRDYLLSTTHPVGKFKAAFFRALGYTSTDWPRLRDDLVDVARAGDAEPTDATEYGQKYEMRATITGPAPRSATVVTVWIVREDEDFPRLVTVYPA